MSKINWTSVIRRAIIASVIVVIGSIVGCIILALLTASEVVSIMIAKKIISVLLWTVAFLSCYFGVRQIARGKMIYCIINAVCLILFLLILKTVAFVKCPIIDLKSIFGVVVASLLAAIVSCQKRHRKR